MNRITGATDNTTNYNVSNISYDKNGNIQSLTRNGFQDSSTFTNMDVLDYDYDGGNKLTKVSDTGNDDYGFIDRADQSVEFTYDINGNLLTDVNKGITGIQWNHLNMPTGITVSNPQHNGTISYVYSANGIKLRKVVNESGNTTTTDYAGAYQYVNGNLEFINNFEDGYVYPKNDGSYGYMYYYTDQLDNIRLMYSDADNDGSIDAATEIVKEEHFYPYGLKLEGFNGNVQAIGSGLHKYDYQNQERQDELGLNWLQFKYRMHDPAIGRFVSIDPLADSYVHNSTYAFAENKVIKFNELEGLEITLNKFDKLNRENRLGFEGHAVFLANAGISLVNQGIGIFNYAGDLDRADQSGQGSFNKIGSDLRGIKSGIENYVNNATAESVGTDIVNAAKDPNTAEDLFGGYVSGAAFTKFAKLGTISKADNFVFRGDTRSPSQIFKEGFTSKGTNFDLQGHASGLFDDSGFISTSKSFDVAKNFAGEGGFVYKIKTPSNGIDVNVKLGSKSPYPSELEIAVPLEIDASLIKSFKKVNSGNGLNINF